MPSNSTQLGANGKFFVDRFLQGRGVLVCEDGEAHVASSEGDQEDIKPDKPQQVKSYLEPNT